MSAGAFEWTALEVRRALAFESANETEEVRFRGVSTDSRTTAPGDLYVALLGQRHDGHDFLSAAVHAGARGAVVSRAPAEPLDTLLFPVDDTLVALGRLARHRRSALSARVVGITGSTGKTGTKDLTAAALAASLKVHATKDNENNRIGVPFTLLAAPRDADIVVSEMGSNEPGEIGILTEIGRPDLGVITNVSESHLEKLGSLERVLKEKLSLLKGLPPESSAFVGDTPPVLSEASRRVRPDVRVAGWSERADPDLRPLAPEVSPRGTHSFSWRGTRVRLAVPGRHQVLNALLALAVAESLGVEPARAAEGVGSVGPGWLRGEVRQVGGLTLLLDCYNANPQSVAAALDLLGSFQARRRVAVLGSMLELGARSEALHRRVLDEALGLGHALQLVVATGAFAHAAEKGGPRRSDPELLAISEPETAYAELSGRLTGDEVVLLKASRRVKLERLVPLFEQDFGATGGMGR